MQKDWPYGDPWTQNFGGGKKKKNNNINNNKEASTLNSNKFYSFKKTVSHNSQ